MPLSKKIQLRIVSAVILALNLLLEAFREIFFRELSAGKPTNILVYKIGNIGDIVCAVPAFIAIRRAYPEARITLLTSPGTKGNPGAKELLQGVWYLDDIYVYYAESIASFNQKKGIINFLRKNRYDLFIQLPDDIASFRTLLRNMFFAKVIGVKSAVGFKIRTIQLFKKAQVDYSAQSTEVESLLDLLRANDIPVGKVGFDFNVSEEEKEKVKKFISRKWKRRISDKLIVALSPGGKRSGNQWPIEKFAETAKYLQDKYRTRIIVVGGKADVPKAEVIKANLKDENILITAGELSILETYELLKYCSFMISNSTGTIHLAAAAGLPTIGLYSIRDVFGRWFPYGKQNEIICRKFLDCDYRSEDCIKKSIVSIPVHDVKRACESVLGRI